MLKKNIKLKLKLISFFSLTIFFTVVFLLLGEITLADFTTYQECLDNCGSTHPNYLSDLTERQAYLDCAKKCSPYSEKPNDTNHKGSVRIDSTPFALNIPIGNIQFFGLGNNMLGEYIRAWYNFMLGTIGILAAVMIMVGGFKYLTSQGDKGQIQTAQNTIISAITGLVLAFGMHAILSLVNPNLLTLKMPDIRDIEYSGTYTAEKSRTDTTPHTPGRPPAVGTDNRSNLTEAEARQQLEAAGIRVNKDPCPPGVRYQDVPGGCTSVAGLTPATINNLKNLKNNCNCEITVTGGTELGHHGGDRGNMVDLSKRNGKLNDYIKEVGTRVDPCFREYPSYKLNGYYYVDEGDHWHVQPNC